MRIENRVMIVGILFALALMPFSGQGEESRTKAWEGTITIPTYPWGPDDINPKFFALENSIIYPYTMQDYLSTKKVDRTYRALFLENEYLRVTCLPELAGRIHSVFDKTTNHEMFHTNSVIKPGLIAMRGAWISGGIEWNTGPQVHTVTCVTPVDVLIQEHTDGAASLVIGNIEQIFRTRWIVRLTLHPGRAYLDEQIRLYNPRDGVHPYYFWNCTAFYCLPGTRFIYPMTLGTDHAGTSFYSWPIDNGKDLTWLKNYDRPSSVFAYNCVFDFFGAYDVDLDRGIVQYANHNLLIGKKAWTWGQSGDGIVSQKALHEGNEQYIEVQSGPLLTQADYGLLRPREAVAWREWWYPVHGLGDGFEYATRDVAFQTSRKPGEWELRMMATREIPHAEVRLVQGEHKLLKKAVSLSPREATVVTLPDPPEGAIEITLLENANPIAAYTSPLPIPKVTPPDPHWLQVKPENQLTAEEKYLKGLLFDKQTNRPAAREWYTKALAEDPQFVPALKGLAVLDFEAAKYTDAASNLEKALARDPDDGMAWYYLGAARLKLAQWEEARHCGYQAVRKLATAAQGYDLVGRASMNLGDPQFAVQAFQQAAALNPEDLKAFDHLILAMYAAGMHEEAYDLARKTMEADPLNLIPRAVMALRDETAMRNFAEQARSFVGEYDFEIMETCFAFTELGMIREAAQILRGAYLMAIPERQQTPLPLYLAARLEAALGNDSAALQYLKQASRKSSDYVFPAHTEMIDAMGLDVLGYAIQKNPKDAKARLYRGNLLGALGSLEDAVIDWKKAADLDPSLSVAFRNLGLYEWRKNGNLDEAEADYRKAIKARPKDQTLYRDLAQILIQNQKRPQAVALIEKMPRKGLRNDLIEILSQAYVDEKQYDKAITLLDNSYFSNWETRTVSRNVFVRAHIERGKLRMESQQFQKALDDFATALTYPEHLGVGRPAEPAIAEALFWKGKALAALGRIEEARAAWTEGSQSKHASGHERRFIEQCREALGS